MRQDEIQVRQARVEDAAGLAAAQRQIAQVPGRLASTPAEILDAALAERIARLATCPTGTFVVAEVAGQIVGHALLDPLKLAVTAHVVDLTMAVHEGHQGQGVGRRLLSHLLDWARDNPRVARVELRVRSTNTRAIALYRSLGFVEEGRMRRRIQIAPGQYLDDLVMGLWVGD